MKTNLTTSVHQYDMILHETELESKKKMEDRNVCVARG